VVIAVPVAPVEAAAALRAAADEVVAAMTPRNFAAVGQWYVDFSPTSNDEVTRLLARWRS
jgi:predicted phosphoribosyltransferase